MIKINLVCVCVWEWLNVCVCVCMCMCVRESECVCVCVRERERGERERECVNVCVCVWVSVWCTFNTKMHLWHFLHHTHTLILTHAHILSIFSITKRLTLEENVKLIFNKFKIFPFLNLNTGFQKIFYKFSVHFCSVKQWKRW